MSQTGETEEVGQRSETLLQGQHGSQSKAQRVSRKHKTPSGAECSSNRSDGSPGPSRAKRRRSGVELPSSSSSSEDELANKDLVPQTCEASAGFSCSSVRSEVSPGPSEAETKKVDVPSSSSPSSSSSSSEEDEPTDPGDSDSKVSTSSSVSIRSDMSMPDYENFTELQPRPRQRSSLAGGLYVSRRYTYKQRLPQGRRLTELALRPSALVVSQFGGSGPAHSSSGTPTVTPPVAPQSEEGALAEFKQLALRLSALVVSQFRGSGPAHSSSGTPTVTPPVAPQSEEGAPAEFKVPMVPMRPSSPKGSSAVSSKGDGPEGPSSAK